MLNTVTTGTTVSYQLIFCSSNYELSSSLPDQWYSHCYAEPGGSAGDIHGFRKYIFIAMNFVNINWQLLNESLYFFLIFMHTRHSVSLHFKSPRSYVSKRSGQIFYL
jgi:hypothetical protein